MSGTLNEQLQQIADTKDAIAQAINDKGVSVTSDDSFATYATKIAEIQGGSGETVTVQGGNCFSLFDTKQTPYLIEDKGWALQGSTISSKDYSQFYDRCISEYNESVDSIIPISSNMQVTGNPTVNNFIYTNFSTSKYIYTNYKLSPASKDSWEINIRLSYDGSLSTSWEDLINTADNSGFILRLTDHILRLYVTNDSNSWNIANSVAALKPLSANTFYHIKFQFTGSAYIVSVSEDGINYEEYINVPSTQQIKSQSAIYFGVRRRGTTYENYLAGSIDATYTNIKVNGEVVWSGTNNIEGKQHKSLRTYYDISNKDLVDELFNKQGKITMFGIDTENKQIILPKQPSEENIYYCVEEFASQSAPMVSNLFDIKIADHILEGEEALGWAEQGTKVYKTDYPDFYNKCLQEYQQGVLTQHHIISYVLHEGNVIDNDGVLSNFTATDYAKIAETVPLTGNTWEIVFKVLVKSKNTQQYFLAPPDGEYGILLGVNNGKLNLYLSKNGTSWVDNNGYVGVTDLIEGQEYYFKLVGDKNSIVASLSTDKLSWTEEITQSYVINDVDINIGQRMGRYFWSGSVDLNECYININDQRWWTGTYTFECKKYVNEHIFFDIDNKYLADECLSINNSAWLYGVDEQNEYIMLPRTNNFSKLDKHVYICVGNTVKDESIIDLSKEIELNNPFFLGQSQYFENEPNNLSWLKSTGEFHSKEMYPSMFEYIKENVEKGTNDFKLITEEYDDYCYILDEENNKFRLPLLNGNEDRMDNGEMLTNVLPSTLVSGNSYTFIAPCNGSLKLANTSSSGLIYMNLHSKDGISQGITVNNGKIVGGTVNTSLFMLRGQKCIIEGIGNATLSSSIFVKTVGNGSLYYYVGEAVNNAQLIDLGKITTEIATKVSRESDAFDGEWISTSHTVADSVQISTSAVIYDITEVLPKDEYDYEVLFYGSTMSAATNGAYINLYIATDIITSSVGICGSRARTNASIFNVGNGILPVGSDRYVKVTSNTSGNGTYYLYICGYRRLGRKENK